MVKEVDSSSRNVIYQCVGSTPTELVSQNLPRKGHWRTRRKTIKAFVDHYGESNSVGVETKHKSITFLY